MRREVPVTRSSSQATYAVPRRFGLAAMLAFTTLFAGVSGILRYHDAPVSAYLFFGALGTVVCAAQMYSKGIPRLVSIIAGAVFLQLFLGIEVLRRGEGFDVFLAGGLCVAAAGGFIGYLTGAISAGVFLVADLVEQRWRGEMPVAAELIPDAKLPEGTPVYTSDSCTPYLSEQAAQVAAGEPSMETPTGDAPRVKKLAPPSGVPVYNCVALVAPRGADGLVHARAANVSDLRTSGASEREALQHLVGAFKIIITQSLAEGREVPLLVESHPAQPGEVQRFIAVHL